MFWGLIALFLLAVTVVSGIGVVLTAREIRRRLYERPSRRERLVSLRRRLQNEADRSSADDPHQILLDTYLHLLDLEIEAIDNNRRTEQRRALEDDVRTLLELDR